MELTDEQLIKKLDELYSSIKEDISQNKQHLEFKQKISEQPSLLFEIWDRIYRIKGLSTVLGERQRYERILVELVNLYQFPKETLDSFAEYLIGINDCYFMNQMIGVIHNAPKEKLTAVILKNGNIYDLCEFMRCAVNPPIEETIQAVIERATDALQLFSFINILAKNFSIKYDDKAIEAKSKLFKAFVSFGDVSLINNVLNETNYGERDGDLMFEGFTELLASGKIDKVTLRNWLTILRTTSCDSFMPFVNLEAPEDIKFMVCRMYKLSKENQIKVCEAFISAFQIKILSPQDNMEYYSQIMNNYFYGSNQYFKPFLEYILMKQENEMDVEPNKPIL